MPTPTMSSGEAAALIERVDVLEFIFNYTLEIHNVGNTPTFANQTVDQQKYKKALTMYNNAIREAKRESLRKF